MNVHYFFIIFLIIVFTVISGLADAQGFLHAATAWNHGKIIWPEALKSLLGFIIGAVGYILATNYLKQAGVVLPELQTMIWFIVAMLAVAILNRELLHWQRIDQIVAVVAVICIGWLVIHHG